MIKHMSDSQKKYKIAFFGTPELCIPYLEKLQDTPFQPSLIVTNPDRPQGRKHSDLIAPPVKKWAQSHDIACLQPESITPEWIESLQEKGDWDLFIVIAYGKILPKTLINLPKNGTINVHYSLLPRWRGATPVEAAILHGDATTGVSIQKMRYMLDAGPVISSASIELDNTETSQGLREILTTIGADLLLETLPGYLAGKLKPILQNNAHITTCTLIAKSDGEVNLSKMTDDELFRRYRAYTPWPGIFFFDEKNDNKRIKISSARFENSTFITESVIPEGKGEQDWETYTKKRA